MHDARLGWCERRDKVSTIQLQQALQWAHTEAGKKYLTRVHGTYDLHRQKAALEARVRAARPCRHALSNCSGDHTNPTPPAAHASQRGARQAYIGARTSHLHPSRCRRHEQRRSHPAHALTPAPTPRSTAPSVHRHTRAMHGTPSTVAARLHRAARRAQPPSQPVQSAPPPISEHPPQGGARSAHHSPSQRTIAHQHAPPRCETRPSRYEARLAPHHSPIRAHNRPSAHSSRYEARLAPHQSPIRANHRPSARSSRCDARLASIRAPSERIIAHRRASTALRRTPSLHQSLSRAHDRPSARPSRCGARLASIRACPERTIAHQHNPCAATHAHPPSEPVQST
jgi:hypothetical protein